MLRGDSVREKFDIAMLTSSGSNLAVDFVCEMRPLRAMAAKSGQKSRNSGVIEIRITATINVTRNRYSWRRTDLILGASVNISAPTAPSSE